MRWTRVNLHGEPSSRSLDLRGAPSRSAGLSDPCAALPADGVIAEAPPRSSYLDTLFLAAGLAHDALQGAHPRRGCAEERSYLLIQRDHARSVACAASMRCAVLLQHGAPIALGRRRAVDRIAQLDVLWNVDVQRPLARSSWFATHRKPDACFLHSELTAGVSTT